MRLSVCEISMNEKRIKLECESKVELVPILGKAVRGICSCCNLTEEFLFELELVLVEAATNVVIHAYEGKEGFLLEVIVSFTEEYITFQIIDSGIRNINKLHKPRYDPENINSLPESGLGSFLIHQYMDEVDYKENCGKNELTLKKYYEKTS